MSGYLPREIVTFIKRNPGKVYLATTVHGRPAISIYPWEREKVWRYVSITKSAALMWLQGIDQGVLLEFEAKSDGHIFIGDFV